MKQHKIDRRPSMSVACLAIRMLVLNVKFGAEPSFCTICDACVSRIFLRDLGLDSRSIAALPYAPSPNRDGICAAEIVVGNLVGRLRLVQSRRDIVAR